MVRIKLWRIRIPILFQIDVLKGLNCQDYNQIYELQSFLQSLRIQKEQEESIKRKMLVIVAEQVTHSQSFIGNTKDLIHLQF